MCLQYVSGRFSSIRAPNCDLVHFFIHFVEQMFPYEFGGLTYYLHSVIMEQGGAEPFTPGGAELFTPGCRTVHPLLYTDLLYIQTYHLIRPRGGRL